MLVDGPGEDLESGRLDENLVATSQLQLTIALLADFDLDQFLFLAAIPDQLQAHYRAHRKNMEYTCCKCAAAINFPVHMDIVRTYVSHCRKLVCIAILRRFQFDAFY